MTGTQTSSDESRPEAFPCFDGLRALAALSVFTYHSARFTRIQYPHFYSDAVFNWLDRLGFFGIAVFFAISGFLLYRPYVVAARDGRRGPRLLPFWSRRFARVFPAYWVALAFLVVVFGQYEFRSIGHAFTFATLTQTYRATYGLRGLGVAWTLCIEVSFYVALPGIAWVLRRLGGLRGQLIGLAAMAATGIAARSWWLWTTRAVPHSGDWFEAASFDRWIPGYLDWFALGMLMAVLSAYRVRVNIPAWAAWTGAMVGVGAVVLLDLDAQLGPGTYAPLDSFLRWLFTGLAGALFVVPGVFGTGGAIRRLLRTRVLVALGAVSFGIYLWHVPFWIQAPSWSWFPSSVPAQITVVFGLTVTAATISYWLIERPINRTVRRLGQRADGVRDIVRRTDHDSVSWSPGGHERG